MEQKYIIGHVLCQRLVAYLSTRPYREVFELIAELGAIPPIGHLAASVTGADQEAPGVRSDTLSHTGDVS